MSALEDWALICSAMVWSWVSLSHESFLNKKTPVSPTWPPKRMLSSSLMAVKVVAIPKSLLMVSPRVLTASLICLKAS